MRSSVSATVLAVVLAATAGLVDAVGFLHLHGYFVSFMSGNSTRLGVGLAAGDSAGVTAGALIGTFVLGAMAGAVVSQLVPGPRRRAAVLGLVTLVLAVATGCGVMGLTEGSNGAMAFAMGCENAVFARGSTVGTGLTYMTGALVKSAHGLVGAFFGGPRLAWIFDALLWAGLASGAVLGARLFAAFGVATLGLAAATTAVCTLWTLVEARWLGT